MPRKAKTWRPVDTIPGLLIERFGDPEKIDLVYRSDDTRREHRIVVSPTRPHIQTARKLFGRTEFLPLGDPEPFQVVKDLRGVGSEPRIMPTHPELILRASPFVSPTMVAVKTEEGTFAVLKAGEGVEIFQFAEVR